MRRLAPSTRLACGVLIFASCLALPIFRGWGVSMIFGTVLIWVAFCGIPLKRLGGLSLYSITLFLPCFLISPWLEPHPALNGYWFATVGVPLEISLRGAACIFICAATVASLDLSEFNMGLVRLPIPRAMAGLIFQIVHQTAMLTDESTRIASALRLRGMPTGFMMNLKFLPALPTIWLLRTINRAERIAAAMALRGFELPRGSACEPRSWLDTAALAAAFLLLGASLTLRCLENS